MRMRTWMDAEALRVCFVGSEGVGRGHVLKLPPPPDRTRAPPVARRPDGYRCKLLPFA
jgi:hypothetical protein